MCTVTYLPTSAGFVLTHNRDEAPDRSPKIIERADSNYGGTLLFPRDTRAGGTWVAAAQSGKIACLLNGAFVKHAHRPPYRRSRGLLLLDFFDWADSDDFFGRYDLDGIEPFTLLFFQQKKSANAENSRRTVEFRWDGQARHHTNLPSHTPHFWCSATLYSPDWQVRREQVFRDWLRQKSAALRRPKAALLDLHLHGSVGDPEFDFVMNRGNRVRTVSVSQVTVDKNFARLRYLDLLSDNQDERAIRLRDREKISVNG
jgi:hypothetical protein